MAAKDAKAELDAAKASAEALAAALKEAQAAADRLKPRGPKTQADALKDLVKEAQAAARAYAELQKASDAYDKDVQKAGAARDKREAQSLKDRAKALAQVAAAEKEAAKPKGGGFSALFGDSSKLAGVGALVGKLFGVGVKGQLEKGISSLGSSLDSTGLTPGMLTGAASALSGAGGVVMSGATAVLAASVALAAAGTAITVAGYKFGVEQTTQKEQNEAVLKHLGAKGGTDFTKELAGKYGLNEDDAVQQVKKLLNAKFDESEIDVLIKIKAGMGAAGLDGDALLKKLETIKLEPKVKGKDIDGLAKMGIDTKAVYADLAKRMGTDVPTAMAKVKSGAADSGQVIASIESVAGKSFGPLAEMLGNSVPGLLGKLKMAFGDLFEDMDLQPLKDFLNTVIAALTGGAGADLKKSFQELFGAISHTLFDPFKGPEGQKKLENVLKTMAGIVRDVASAVREAAPGVKALVELLGSGADKGAQGGQGLAAIEGGLLALSGPIGETIQFLLLLSHTLDAITDALGLTGDKAKQGGTDIGAALVNGIQDAILGGAGAVANAAASMVQAAIAAAMGAADAHSPSRKMAKLGGFMGQGMAGGMDAQNDNAASAGAGMANAAMGGAGGGAGAAMAAGGGGKGAAGGGGGGPSITVNVAPPAGMTPEQGKAIGQAVGDAAYAAWQAHDRRNGREKRERAA